MRPQDTEGRRHRMAIRLARKLVEIISPCLRPEERLDAFREFYEVVHDGLERYESDSSRSLSAPSPN
jgi:hypothetical protein